MLINPMAYGFSNFNFRKQSLFTARQPFDLTYETSCSGFTIKGTEPPDTSRRIIFKIDDHLFKFGSSGLIPYIYHGAISDILQFGNTVEELLKLNDIPEFVGKKVYPIIALDAPSDAPVMPKISISLNVNSFNDIYTRYYYSPVFDLPDNPRLFKFVEDKFTNGHATSLTETRLKKKTGWDDWQLLTDAEFETASAIQFRTNPILSTLDGSDEVDLKSLTCHFTTDADISAADSQEFITLPQSYDADLKNVYVLIHHDDLQDASIKAFVNFAQSPKRRENYRVFFNSDSLTIKLNDPNIAQDTFHIEVNNTAVSNFYFDTEDSTLTLDADSDSVISTSYDYNFNDENWLEMSLDFQNKSKSRFIFNSDQPGNRILAVKIVVSRNKGTGVIDFGTGTGRFQSFSLPHAATNFSTDTVYRYDEDAQIIKVISPLDSSTNATYSWRGKLPKIHSYTVGASI